MINGIDLRPFGIDNIGLNLENSVKFIEFCEKDNVRIIGGDKYEVIDSNLINTYENFYSGSSDPVSFTINKARKFINKEGSGSYFYVFTISY